MKQFKTTPQHRESQKKYRGIHRLEQIESCKNWHKNNPNYQPEYMKSYHVRMITFRGKQVLLDENPRKGTCTKCGNTTMITHMHHKQYDNSNVLNHTVELCASCHAKEHDFGEKKK